LETVTVVAEEPGIVVVALHVVGSEIQTIRHVLPIRDQRSHVIVHGQIRIPVHLATHSAEVPAAGEVRVAEVPEVEGNGRGHDEEVSDARIVFHVPVGGAREKDPVISARPGVVVLLRRRRKHHPDGAVGVDVEDSDEGVFRNPVVDAGPLSPLQNGFGPPVQPDPGFQGVIPVLLSSGGRGCQARHGRPPQGQYADELPQTHVILL